MFWNEYPTHRRRKAALAAAFLLAASAFSAWFDDGSDSAVSAGIMNVDDEDTGYLRRLAAHLFKTDEFFANRARLMSAPGCNGVLLTSQGGVGSTAFIGAIEVVQMRGSSFYTNDDRDEDGFKHRPASWWKEHDAGALHVKSRDGKEHCFGKVLVVVGDPVHTVESTVRRFRMVHINKLKKGSELGVYPNRLSVKRLYGDMAAAGTDTTGITQYVTGWYEASREREHWPDTRIVTAKTLFDHAEDHARWIGVEERDMHMFQHMSFDAGRQRSATPSVSSAETAEKVMEVFAEAIDLVGVIDNLSYNEGGGQPDEPPPLKSKRARRRAQQIARASVRHRSS